MSLNQWEQELSEEDFQMQIDRAKEAWKEAEANEPRARSIHYDRGENLIVIKLKNGTIFSFPPHLAQGLEDASDEQLADAWLPPSGSSVHWESLDVDFGIPELIAGIFGTKSWMAELGKKGGKATSQAKANAARKNGQKGGRPKKKTPLG